MMPRNLTLAQLLGYERFLREVQTATNSMAYATYDNGAK
jgi:hypothetical protein